MERDLLKREINSLNYEANPLMGFRGTSSADAEYKEYPSGKFYGVLKEKSLLREKELKTKQTFNGHDLYYPNKQRVDVLGEDGDWFQVEGNAKYVDKKVEHDVPGKLKGFIKKSWIKLRRDYPPGKFHGFLNEKAFLREEDLKTLQKENRKLLYYPNKEKVDILSEADGWLLVEGNATNDGLKNLKLQGWIKKSWITVPEGRAMKLELQTGNVLFRTDGKKKKIKLPRKFGPRQFLHKGAKGEPAKDGKEGTAVELQSETDGFVEFETPKFFDDWCKLKERIQEAAEMVEAINKAVDVTLSGGVKTVKFPFDTKHLGLPSGEYLIVEIGDPDWGTKIQVSEAIELSQYESLLREHERPALITFSLDTAKEILNDANTAKLPDASLVNLLSFLQIIANYIQRGQKVSLKDSSGKRHPSKFTFQLMCRTSFSSIFSGLLSSDEQNLFRQIVDKKLILDKFKLTDASQFFVDGHATSKTRPTVSAWLKSIVKPLNGKDLLSYSAVSVKAGGFNGSQAMGRFDIKTPEDTVRFEARASTTHGVNINGEMIKKSKDWVSFTETVFKKAFTDRKSSSGADLKYKPAKCP